MNNIPTAWDFIPEDFIQDHWESHDQISTETDEGQYVKLERVCKLMESYLKLHLEEVIKAWEALPGGKNYSAKEIENWLSNDMKPMINQIREKLKTL